MSMDKEKGDIPSEISAPPYPTNLAKILAMEIASPAEMASLVAMGGGGRRAGARRRHAAP